MPDTLIRFDFVDAAIRGEIVRLDHSWQAICSHRDYPPPVRQVLGELTAASVLLAASLKFEGSLALQLQGAGPLRLAVAEARDSLKVRATADWNELGEAATLPQLLGRGTFAVMLDASVGEPYQGIVEVEGDGVGAALEGYMARSQQIPTRLILACNAETACGLLLQRLPDQSSADADAWDRLTALASTLGAGEMLAVSPDTLLHRLFHEESVRLYPPRQPSFGCRCSAGRVEGMLRMIGREEVEAILAEQGEVKVACEFCNQSYRMDAAEALALFGPGEAGSYFSGNPTRH